VAPATRTTGRTGRMQGEMPAIIPATNPMTYNRSTTRRTSLRAPSASGGAIVRSRALKMTSRRRAPERAGALLAGQRGDVAQSPGTAHPSERSTA
jgi:hypothetical protein